MTNNQKPQSRGERIAVESTHYLKLIVAMALIGAAFSYFDVGEHKLPLEIEALYGSAN